MITVYDILQHIAQETGHDNGTAKGTVAGNMPADVSCNVRVSITTDVEATELGYLQRYGHGHTLYFSIGNSEQGQKLAEDLYDLMPNVHPEASLYADYGEDQSKRLYLFIHIRHLPRKGRLQISHRQTAGLK